MSFTYQHITLIQHQSLKLQKHRPSSVFLILVYKYDKNTLAKSIFSLESLIASLLFIDAFLCIVPVRAAEGYRAPGSMHTVRLFR